MTLEVEAHRIEITGEGIFALPMYEDKFREFDQGKGTPLKRGALVQVWVKHEKERDPVYMWQQITDIRKEGQGRLITITDINIPAGMCDVGVVNIRNGYCEETIAEQPEHVKKAKEQMNQRYRVAQDIMVKFIQLDDKEGTKQFMIDPKHIMRALMGDEEFSLDNTRVVCPETGKLRPLE